MHAAQPYNSRDTFRLHLASISRSIHTVSALWIALPSELEAFHLYSEQCLTSIAGCGHKAARSQHRMLTDSLPEPHLPYTDQERSTEGRGEERMQRQMDGWGPKSTRIILSFAHFITIFLRPYRGAAVPSTRARNSYLPGVLLFSQKRGGDLHRNIHNAHCSMQQKEKEEQLRTHAIMTGGVSF